MLTQGVQVDQRPAVCVPEQVMAFEVTMTDALANQLGKQMIQRQQLIFWRVTALNVRRKTLDDVRPR